ncbi:MAG: AAA family ATPase [Candidatus Lokiarchaeota archaeon]|nr:AAA family ATPase [Candidatus Lokiarchaeota archaeon]
MNEEQLTAVLHEQGPALVVAGPGSGKTRVLTHRVAWLLSQDVRPDSIMLVTFTKKAAQEMISRVQQLSYRGAAVVAGTFHHIAYIFLRRYVSSLPDLYSKSFTIIDQGDQEKLFKLVIQSLIDQEDRRLIPKPKDFVRIVSYMHSTQMSLLDVVREEFPNYIRQMDRINSVVNGYKERKIQGNMMDFSDLLTYFLILLRDTSAGIEIKNQIDHVLVDEYQDVNALQEKIIRELSGTCKSLMVVGDDAQSIYSFRGGSAEFMLDFEDQYQSVTKYFLTKNYRSRPSILRLVNASIEYNEEQIEKQLESLRPEGDLPIVTVTSNSREQAAYVISKIQEYNESGIPFDEIAILYRARWNSLEFEKACVNSGIRYDIRGGIRFFERSHIKDVTALVTIFVNPREILQWNRILSMLSGVGEITASKIVQKIQSKSNPLTAFLTLGRNDFSSMSISSIAISSIISLQRLFTELAELDENHSGLTQINPMRFLSLCLEFLEPIHQMKFPDEDEFRERWNDVREFMSFSDRYDSLDNLLADILTMVNISTRTSKLDDKDRPIVLSTVHQAKGLEWQVVFVTWLNQGVFPHSMSLAEDNLEEERRLFYVACTRAKDFLHLTFSEYARSWQNSEGVSQFIEEIMDENVFQIFGNDIW